MKVLMTGANGFIGKNLLQHLAQLKDIQVVRSSCEEDPKSRFSLFTTVDFVFHLAGVNRPQEETEFVSGNQELTKAICRTLAEIAHGTGRKIPVAYASSTQVHLDNAYGASKRGAEDALFALQRDYGVPIHVFRLPNVFGKWAKPNYNSVVATFCHNIARGLPIKLNDPEAPLRLVYVDDVIAAFVDLMGSVGKPVTPVASSSATTEGFTEAGPVYATTVGEVAQTLKGFAGSRSTLLSARVGSGFLRALYSTYISYLPPERFAYPVPQHADFRGVFVEMLKTPDCGQFSYFTTHPGVTRGGHYHHSKTEKFLVIKGQARFNFRQVQSGQTYQLITSGSKPEIVETVPGWTHDITNIGTDEMIVMLWANEVFDRERPDTFACPV